MSGSPYGKTAQWYDTFIGPVTAGLRTVGLSMVDTRPGMHVLDVGCGTGTLLDLLRQTGCRVCGLDLSPAMLDVARHKLGDCADLKLGDATCMPYAAGSFDLITIVLALHEMPPPDRSAVLNEAKRVMKEDSRLLLIDYDPGPIRFPDGWLSKSVITFFEVAAGGEHLRNYRDFLVRHGLPSLIEEHRLVVEKKQIVGGGSLGLFLLSRE